MLNALFGLPLNPVQMLRYVRRGIGDSIGPLLGGGGPREQVGVSHVDIGQKTPHHSIFAMFEIGEQYQRYGG